MTALLVALTVAAAVVAGVRLAVAVRAAFGTDASLARDGDGTAGFDAVRDVLQLTRDLPSPELAAEEDGDLCLDWMIVGASLSVSVSRHGRVAFAAIAGRYTAHGQATGVLPDGLIAAVAHYAEASEAVDHVRLGEHRG